MKMKIKFWVMEESRRESRQKHEADCEEEAIAWIEKHTPADLLGKVVFSIKKVYTNE